MTGNRTGMASVGEFSQVGKDLRKSLRLRRKLAIGRQRRQPGQLPRIGCQPANSVNHHLRVAPFETVRQHHHRGAACE